MNTEHPKPHWLPAHPEGQPFDAAQDKPRAEPQSGNGQQNTKAQPSDQKPPPTEENQAAQQSQRTQPQSGANGTQGSGVQGPK